MLEFTVRSVDVTKLTRVWWIRAIDRNHKLAEEETPERILRNIAFGHCQ